MSDNLPIVRPRFEKFIAEIEKGKACLEKAFPHLLKSQVMCDKVEALLDAGKISHVNEKCTLIEVFEIRINADGSQTQRYTRIAEGGVV